MNLNDIPSNYTKNGLFGQLEEFEERPGQIKLAHAIDNAFNNHFHLLADAPCGIGKSFAYLIPAIKYSKLSKKPVIISTNTINLQEQLIEKDIPLLKKYSTVPFEAVLLKGRSNYICLRRVERASEYNKFKGPQIKEFLKIKDWVNSMSFTGDKADLGFEVNPYIWEELCSDSSRCDSKCTFIHQCPALKIKRKLRSANIIVVNHALFCSHLEVKRATKGKITILPDSDYIIFDEGHNLPEVAMTHFSTEITEYSLKRTLNNLYNLKSETGLLVEIIKSSEINKIINVDTIISEVECAWTEVEHLFSLARNRYNLDGKPVLLKDNSFIAYHPVLSIWAHLGERLEFMKNLVDDDEDLIEVKFLAEQFKRQKQILEVFLDPNSFDMIKKSGKVYWIEAQGKNKNIHLICSPINVADILQNDIFDVFQSVLVISATMAIDGKFGFIASQLGVLKEETKGIRVESTFDYSNQAQIYIPNITPPEKSCYDQYLADLKTEILKILKRTNGRALVLFTNYKDMTEVYKEHAGILETEGIRTLMQGTETRKAIIAQLRNDINSVVFGVNAFREGVDIQGEALSCVIITKLPFEVPDTPLNEARIENLKSCGKNPFVEMMLPAAVIDLQQAVGRLIRTKTDTGLIAILDSRIKTKNYGKIFLNSLPKIPIISNLSDLKVL